MKNEEENDMLSTTHDEAQEEEVVAEPRKIHEESNAGQKTKVVAKKRNLQCIKEIRCCL